MKYCKHCGRTIWEQILGAPGREAEGSGNFFHHHNGDNRCFPYLVAEPCDDDPNQYCPAEPEPEPETLRI